MNILLPFFDDSTLFIAKKFYDSLDNINCNIIFSFLCDKDTTISDRQLSNIDDSYVMYKMKLTEFYDAQFLSMFDLVVYSRVPGGSFKIDKIKNKDIYFKNARPYFLSLISGIDFTPEKGIQHRIDADGICIPDDFIREKYKDLLKELGDVFKFHPYFCIKKKVIDVEVRNIKNIYFFAQAIVPFSLNGRIDIISMLIDICYRYPDKNVFIKLRQLKNENQKHAHREMFSYVDIVKLYAHNHAIPENLSFCIDNMENVLKKADFCITCNSTAGIEALCAGIPTAFFLDYDKDNSDSFLKKESLDYFKDSNIIYSKNEILNLEIKKVDNLWYQKKMCSPCMLSDIFRAVESFHKRYVYKDKKDVVVLSYKNRFWIEIENKIMSLFIAKTKKMQKYMLRRPCFFMDSKYSVIKLYWKLIGSKL